jgi:hypothetical protein
MSSTTSIHELPVDPAGGSGQANVQLSVNESISPQIPPQQASAQIAPQPPVAPQAPSMPPTQTSLPPPNTIPQTLDPESINSIVTGLQQASASGVTQLMSRDMPITSDHLANDEQIKANYVPPVEEDQNDYLTEEEDNDDILNAYNKKIESENQFDKIYEELQTPLMLAILFFVFQLPFLKKQLFVFVPALFMNDGNYNLYGFVIVSILFAFVYHFITKSMSLFNTF